MAKRADLVVQGAAPQSAVVTMLGIPEQANADELLDIGVQAFNAAGYQMARAGAAFKSLRDRTTHGNPESERSDSGFKAMLEERGIAFQRVYEAIRFVDYLESLPEGQARRMLLVPHTKVLAIAKADPEVVAELLDEGALDGEEPLSVRELRARLKKAEQDKLVQQRKLETKEAELERLKNAANAPGLTKVDAARREVRIAGHGYAELIQLTAAAAARLSITLTEPLFEPSDEHDALVDKAVCTGLAVELEAAKAAVDEALALVLARLDGRVSKKAGDVPLMTAAEVRAARDRRAAVARLTEKERDAAEALAYLRNELDGAIGRGAPPAAVKKVRRKGE